MNGSSLVTSADSNSEVSNSQRDPVDVAASATGRNELGRTSELIAALTGDWSESRWALKPGPIESIAMMICVAFLGGGGVDSVVSVLCGAGGGLTVHAAAGRINAAATTVARSKVTGTMPAYAVSTSSEVALQPAVAMTE